MSKNEGVAIEKLVLDAGGKKIELTIEQAKRLHGALAELFAAKTERHDHYHDYPWVWPYRRAIWKMNDKSLRVTFDSGTKTMCCSV